MIISRTLLVLAVLAGFAVAALAAAQDDPPSTKPETPGTQPESMPDTVHVLVKTSMGDIVLALDNAKAPVSVKNFLSYSERGYYDGTIFHRVINDFMVQGGGFTKDMRQKPTDKPIANEWQNGLKNMNGTIAMARLGRQPDSATSQFFINVKDNPFLDQPRDGAGYAVFGKVVAGMKVVEAIEVVPTGRRGQMGDVPIEPVVMEKVRRISADEAKKLIEAEKGPASRPADD